jgi:hypothetical protein
MGSGPLIEPSCSNLYFAQRGLAQGRCAEWGLGMSSNIPGERYFEQSIEGGVWRAHGAAPLLKAHR